MMIERVVDLLYLNERYFYLLNENGVRIEDVQYIDLFRDYERLSKDGLKRSYIVAHLSDEYNEPILGIIQRSGGNTSTKQGDAVCTAFFCCTSTRLWQVRRIYAVFNNAHTSVGKTPK